MGDYAFVRGPGEEVLGLWLADPSTARNKMVMQMYLMKHSQTEPMSYLTSGDFRVVPNTVDNKGGVFVMFGTTPAPGEA